MNPSGMDVRIHTFKKIVIFNYYFWERSERFTGAEAVLSVATTYWRKESVFSVNREWRHLSQGAGATFSSGYQIFCRSWLEVTVVFKGIPEKLTFWVKAVRAGNC